MKATGERCERRRGRMQRAERVAADEAGALPPTKMPGTATGIVRRVDDLGRIVIPKEIRRTLRIREGDPSQTTLTVSEKYLWAMKILSQRFIAQ